MFKILIINYLDDKAKYSLKMFDYDGGQGGVENTPEGCAAIQMS